MVDDRQSDPDTGPSDSECDRTPTGLAATQPLRPATTPPPATTVHAILPPGTVIARYIIRDQLGTGGMGVVYSAYDPELDRMVALKLLLDRGDESSQQQQARLRREAQAMARMSHPNVVAIYDVGSFDGEIFIAMELVVGVTLDQWLAEGETSGGRSWRTVCALFGEIGRGLAAAHAAGIVHRDFKPGNVLIDRLGRPRITDFGLAGSSLAMPEPSDPSAARIALNDDRSYDGDSDRRSDESRELASALSTSLTRTGALIGTPRYMAPEQHRGVTIDARADQFSFCVVLYEALYDQRPFSGATIGALARAVQSGALIEPPGDARVPPRIHKILARGMATDPAERYPTMDALLDKLGHDPAAQWRKRLLAIGFATAVVAAIIGFTRSPDRAPVLCEGARERLAGVWDQAQKERIERAFTATGLGYAGDTFARVSDQLDRYTRDWAAMHRTACRATHIHRTQSPAVLDLRMRCLDHRLGQLAALSELFAEHPTGRVLDRATSAAGELRPIAACADVEALSAIVPLPDDPAIRAQVATLRQRLSRAEALRRAGSYAEAGRAAEDLVTDSAAVAHPQSHAEALYLLGLIQTEIDDAAGAAFNLRSAAKHAARARDDRLAAEIWTRMVWVLRLRDQHDAAAAIGLAAETHITRIGGQPLLSVQLACYLAESRSALGDRVGAAEYFRKALAIGTGELGPDHPALWWPLLGLGNAALQVGDLDRAEYYARRALDLRVATLGADHPNVAWPLSSVADILVERGHYRRAAQYYRRALTALERSYGPNSAHLTRPLVGLGNSLHHRQQYGQAIDLFRRALSILEVVDTRTYRPHSIHGRLARALAALGQCDAAWSHLQRSAPERSVLSQQPLPDEFATCPAARPRLGAQSR
ncbi:MAG: serine/threonine-protein kinase [Myxococcota bacterium]